MADKKCMEDFYHSEEVAKAPQMACQTVLSADKWASALWNCIKSFILYGKKIHSEDDVIISLQKYTSGTIFTWPFTLSLST